MPTLFWVPESYFSFSESLFQPPFFTTTQHIDDPCAVCVSLRKHLELTGSRRAAEILKDVHHFWMDFFSKKHHAKAA